MIHYATSTVTNATNYNLPTNQTLTKNKQSRTLNFSNTLLNTIDANVKTEHDSLIFDDI